jgi:hypothetical protein
MEPQPLAVVRSEEDASAGVLLVTIAGQTRTVPVLRRRESRAWKKQAATQFGATDIPDNPDLGEFMVSLMDVADEAILDLVVSYDQTSALGGREYLDAKATDRELWDALEAMVTAAFPFAGESPLRSAVATFGEQLKGLISMRIAMLGMRLAQELSSTGSPAPTVGDPASSTTSPMSSTSSTGTTASTATPKRRARVAS